MWAGGEGVCREDPGLDPVKRCRDTVWGDRSGGKPFGLASVPNLDAPGIRQG